MRADRRRPAWPRRGALLATLALAAACTEQQPGAGANPSWFFDVLVAAAATILAVFLFESAFRRFRMRRVAAPEPEPAAPPERWASAVIHTPGSGIRHASGQSRGRRERQEDDLAHIDGDTLAPEGNHSVALVADGMGGHAAGNVASRTAVRGFLQAYGTRGHPRDRLRSALDRANAAIAEEMDRDAALSGMGTTLLAAAVTEEGLHWISVGDSPLYLFRAGRLERLNEDHSMRPVIARLLEEDPDAASHYSPNQLLSVLMGGRIEKTDAPATPRPLEAGDIVLLATDGIETLNEEEMAALIAGRRADGPPAVVEAVLDAVDAKGRPRQDNTSLFVIEIELDSVDAGPAPEPPGGDADGSPAPPEEAPPGGNDAADG